LWLLIGNASFGIIDGVVNQLVLAISTFLMDHLMSSSLMSLSQWI